MATRVAQVNANNYLNAATELELIQKELHRRSLVHLRHFADSFYCYKHGVVNTKGKPDVNRLLTTTYITMNAFQILAHSNAGITDCSKYKPKYALVTRDHVVPIRVIRQLLDNLKNHSNSSPVPLSDIEMALDRHLHHATITKAENQLLSKAKLTKHMPSSVTISGNISTADMFSRYREVGIKLFRYSDLCRNHISITERGSQAVPNSNDQVSEIIDVTKNYAAGEFSGVEPVSTWASKHMP